MARVVVVSACVVGLLRTPFAQAQSDAGTATSTTTVGAASGSSAASPAMPSPGTPDSIGAPATLNGDDVSEARAAFQEGTLLAKQARWLDAVQAFERSNALHPHAITAYNVGYCERLLGHWTRARKILHKALADHRARGEVELPPDLVRATEAYLSEADRQIARVLVTVRAEGAVVGVDGRPLELTDAGGPRPVLIAGTRPLGPAEVPPTPTFEVQLDPGAHRFVLVSKGQPDFVASETVAPGSQTVLPLGLQASESPVASKGMVTDSEGQASDKPNRWPAYIALGIGATSIATGSVAGLLAFGKKGDVSSACGPNGNSDSCNARQEEGNRAADISTIGFIAGGVAVAAGAVLFFTESPRGKAKQSSGSEVRPWVGWKSVGVQGDF